MSYGRFAEIYDQLMSDMPYDLWTRFVLEKQAQFGSTGRRLLDVGCGTGEWTLQIAQEGFEVTGIDLSESMLAVASNKAQNAGVPLQLFKQNMAKVEGFEPFDIITIFCDSLNYLEREEDFKRTFDNMYRQLSSGGLFLFDVHSIFKIEHLFVDQTFTYDDGNVAYIWNSFEGEHPHSAENELSFFVMEDADRDQYVRFDELHKQRTFSIEQYRIWLEDAGFTIESVTADFSPVLSLEENSERIFFTCIK
ncbi:class I SAM-dependent DNA methyltransferase [Jeotgalibacillus marinus]|uniref:Class I SAM-dependent methyltransferase n=1 Tax=Jeotgalibacillus marinus TaxID=86667 RepID=A0ABV3PZP2_9BACL